MDQVTSEFLNSFVQIETYLKDKADMVNSPDFSKVLSECKRRGWISSHQLTEMRRFSHLRNLIVHNYDNREPLAIPTDLTLEKLKHQAQLILNPPRLDSLIRRKVCVCSPKHSLGECIRIMHENDFSQMPIHDGQSLLGLLTSETILRWLSRAIVESGDGIIEQQSVREVMQHQASADNYLFIPRDSTIQVVVKKFGVAQNRGHRLDAILVTQNGRPTEGLLGIATVYDIPRLLAEIH